MMLNSNLDFLRLSDRTYYMGSHMWNDGWLARSYHTGVYGLGVWYFSGFLLLAAAAVMIIALVSLKNKRRAEVLEPLKLRFIKGELTEEEYLSKKAVVLKK